jgi:hypothetical protein
MSAAGAILSPRLIEKSGYGEEEEEEEDEKQFLPGVRLESRVFTQPYRTKGGIEGNLNQANKMRGAFPPLNRNGPAENAV